MKKLLALALAVTMLLALAVPAMAAEVGTTGFAGAGDKPVAAKNGQAAVFKDGEVYDTLGIVYSGNSSANHGYKISANKSYNTISLDGVDVGYFTFDKKGNGPKNFTDFLTIVITNDDYVVDVRWDCSKYYAYASLDGSGTYLLPQLMQDNGKIQSFDQIWISVSKKETPPPTVYGELSIQKTVRNMPFDEWASDKGLTNDEIAAIIGSMNFTAYLLDGENGNRVGSGILGEINLDGVISFGDKVKIGWYEIVEEISGASISYFAGGGGTQVYYVGENGVSSEIQNFVSGQEGVGTVVSHDGTGVNWKLPKVWDDQLGSNALLQKLNAMGAQWIWDKENTYEYGIDGSVVRFDFTVDVAEETTAPIYFAADNAAVIYVNGKLVASTTVAFAGRNIPPTIDEDTTAANFFDSLANDQFDGRWNEGWAHVYKEDITLAAGENTITIFAANSASTGYNDDNGNFVKGTTGTDNDGYNLQNNPCGLIFGFEIPAVTFDNEPIEEVVEYGDVTVSVDFEVTQDTVTFEPVYEYLTEKNETSTLVSYRNHSDNDSENGNATGLFSYKLDATSGKVAIAISNKNNNGGIGQYYNYEIDEDQLVITFDDDLVSADVGIMVSTNPIFPNGHPNGNNQGEVQGVLGKVTGDYSLSITLPEGEDDVYLYLHIAGGMEWYTGEVEIIDWTEIGRETNDVPAEVTALTVELWLDGGLIGSLGLGDVLYGDFNFDFAGLEDGEYTIVVKGTVNGIEFEETEDVTIEGNSSETINITIAEKLEDLEIKN